MMSEFLRSRTAEFDRMTHACLMPPEEFVEHHGRGGRFGPEAHELPLQSLMQIRNRSP